MIAALPSRTVERPFDLVVFGENSLDFVAALRAPVSVAGKQSLAGFDTFPGGQGTTAAIGAARLGVRVCYVGAFGRDPWAAISLEALARDHVEVVAIECDGARSRIAVILVNPDGDRTVFEHRDPRLALKDLAPALTAASRGRLVLVDATDLPASVAIAKAARSTGGRTIVDIDRLSAGAVDLLSQIDVVIAPDALIQELGESADLGRALRAVATRFSPLAVVATMGDEGSWAVAGGQTIRTPAFRVPVVDTTGAGDAFRAGFAAAWAAAGAGGQLEELLQFANATAALNCRALGAQAGLPSAGEVSDLVTSSGRGRSKL